MLTWKRLQGYKKIMQEEAKAASQLGLYWVRCEKSVWKNAQHSHTMVRLCRGSVSVTKPSFILKRTRSFFPSLQLDKYAHAITASRLEATALNIKSVVRKANEAGDLEEWVVPLPEILTTPPFRLPVDPENNRTHLTALCLVTPIAGYQAVHMPSFGRLFEVLSQYALVRRLPLLS